MAGELAAALVAAQAEMPAVEKTARANYGMYATLDALIVKTRHILNEHGIAILQFPAVSDLGQPTLRTILVHTSGEQLSADMPLFVARQDMQNLGSAITYAKRYAWSAALGIAADDDDDGTAASPENQPAFTAPTPRPPAAPRTDGAFTFASGKYEGKTLSEVPSTYLDWYLEKGPREDVKDAIDEFRAAGTILVGQASGDDDIPFAPTIDGTV